MGAASGHSAINDLQSLSCKTGQVKQHFQVWGRNSARSLTQAHIPVGAGRAHLPFCLAIQPWGRWSQTALSCLGAGGLPHYAQHFISKGTAAHLEHVQNTGIRSSEQGGSCGIFETLFTNHGIPSYNSRSPYVLELFSGF